MEILIKYYLAKIHLPAVRVLWLSYESYLVLSVYLSHSTKGFCLQPVKNKGESTGF